MSVDLKTMIGHFLKAGYPGMRERVMCQARVMRSAGTLLKLVAQQTMRDVIGCCAD